MSTFGNEAAQFSFHKAERVNAHTVKALYTYLPLGEDFCLEWCNDNPNTGEQVSYYLKPKCVSHSSLLNNIIVGAITMGYQGYYNIILNQLTESFSSTDCEAL